MPPAPVKTHLPSIAQLFISVAGLVTSLSTALILWGVVGLSLSLGLSQTDDFWQVSTEIWSILIIALVTIPSLILSIRRLARLPMRSNRRGMLLAASISFLVFLGVLFLIYKVPAILQNHSLILFLTLIAVIIPLWWFVEMGQHRLKMGSPQRFWGMVNFEIFTDLPLVFLIEIVFLAAGALIIGTHLADQPEFTSLWTTLQTQLMINPQDFTFLQEKVTQLFQTPVVLTAGLFFFVILVPLVEELLKPLALWFFIRQDWSPTEGFTSGLVCGAAFAFIESLSAIIAMPSEKWLVTLIGRIGTGLLHTLTCGVSGWALASTWKDKKYLRLAVSYLLCVLVHGAWNFFALLFGLNANLEFFQFLGLSNLTAIAPWSMGVLFVLMLAGLWIMNRRLCRTSPPPLIDALPDQSIG